MYRRIIIAIKEGTLISKVKGKIVAFFSKFLLLFVKRFSKINSNQILFLTFQGNYNCNARAIAD